MTGDCFAIVVTGCGPQEATGIARRIQEAAARIRIGPAQQPVEISLSCGVAEFMPAPKAFARTLAAAEIACKAAKDQGRAPLEGDASADHTMMRRHGVLLVVRQRREAPKDVRLVVYAERVAPRHEPYFGGGWHEMEVQPGGGYFRWMSGPRAQVLVPLQGATRFTFALDAQAPLAPEPGDVVRLMSFGREIGAIPFLKNPRSASIGTTHGCAIDDEGVQCWGDNQYGQTTLPAAMGKASALGVGAAAQRAVSHPECRRRPGNVKSQSAGEARTGTRRFGGRCASAGPSDRNRGSICAR
jgi:hypothetical protein